MPHSEGPDEATSRRILTIKIVVVLFGIAVLVIYAAYLWLSER